MYDSVLGLKWALGQYPKSSGQYWLWFLGPTWPKLMSKRLITVCTSSIWSLFSQTVGTLSLVFNLKMKWQRQTSYTRKERKVSREVYIARINSVPHRLSLLVFHSLPNDHPHFSGPHVHPLAFLLCMSGTYAPSFLFLSQGTIISTPLLSISATPRSHCLSVSKSL